MKVKSLLVDRSRGAWPQMLVACLVVLLALLLAKTDGYAGLGLLDHGGSDDLSSEDTVSADRLTQNDPHATDLSDEVIYPIGELQARYQDSPEVHSRVGQSDPTCRIELSESSVVIPAPGASGRMHVTVTGTCGWRVGDMGIPWLAIAGQDTGAGAGILTYTVSPNMSGSDRAAAVSIAGKVFVVTQAGVETKVRTAMLAR